MLYNLHHLRFDDHPSNGSYFSALELLLRQGSLHFFSMPARHLPALPQRGPRVISPSLGGEVGVGEEKIDRPQKERSNQEESCRLEPPMVQGKGQRRTL